MHLWPLRVTLEKNKVYGKLWQALSTPHHHQIPFFSLELIMTCISSFRLQNSRLHQLPSGDSVACLAQLISLGPWISNSCVSIISLPLVVFTFFSNYRTSTSLQYATFTDGFKSHVKLVGQATLLPTISLSFILFVHAPQLSY